MPEEAEIEGESVKVIWGAVLGTWVKVTSPRVEEPVTDSEWND